MIFLVEVQRTYRIPFQAEDKNHAASIVGEVIEEYMSHDPDPDEEVWGDAWHPDLAHFPPSPQEQARINSILRKG